MFASPQTGGTRGGAQDAEDKVKHQAVIIFWKQVAQGAQKMQAYQRAAKLTGNSVVSVRKWVSAENDAGVDGLESKRTNCGAVTRFSPGKKRKIDALMEEAEGDPSLREVRAELGGGSYSTAKSYIQLSGYEKRRKRLKTLLTAEHMQDRNTYCDEHFEDNFQDTCMWDEKLFVLGRRNWRYMKAEDGDQPCLQFVADKNHPPQLMVTAGVMPPLPAKGFNGKVGLFMSCAEWKQAERKSKNRPAGTWEIKPTGTGTLDGEGYFKQVKEKIYPAMEEAKKQLKLKQIKLQDDNAPVHTWAWTPQEEWTGKAKHKDRTGEDLETIGKRLKIKRQHQPARSPDLNALDLYIWRVLEKAVHKRRPKTLEALWEALQDAWENDLTEAKIECAFRLLQPVMACIKNDNGGNAFKLPHTGITKEMRADGWEI